MSVPYLHIESSFVSCLRAKLSVIDTRLRQLDPFQKNVVAFPEPLAPLSFHLAPKVAYSDSFRFV